MTLRLSLLPLSLAVCRLEPDDPVPSWVGGAFTSVTRTNEELSIICEDSLIPEGVKAERDWAMLKVEGPIPFETTGVAAGITAPLAAASISVFLMATWDTDYLLVKRPSLDRAVAALRQAGHEVG